MFPRLSSATNDTNLREKRIIVTEPVGLLMIIARLTDVQHRLNVWVHKSVIIVEDNQFSRHVTETSI
jgi:hypothetical protein